MSYFLYSCAVKLYVSIVYALSPINSRAKELIEGHKNWYKKLQTQLENKNNRQIAWFHCASLGEFEQGKPVMEALKEKGYAILITFFSPSGYKYRHQDAIVDFYSYLPFDSKNNAVAFVNLVKPKLVIWVRYDFWFSYINELNRCSIPLYLISALFREKQPFFKWYGAFQKKHLKYFNLIFCQNQQSVDLLKKHGIENAICTGDTRYDNVWAKAQVNKPAEPITFFSQGERKIIIAGSSYKIEEELLEVVFNVNSYKLIIAPHFISDDRIIEIEDRFKKFKTIRYSKASTIKNLADFDVLILDNIGNLTSAYAVANIAFIGGGFRKGYLHNIIEPSVYGLQICFGPLIDKFPEATEMIELGIAKTISNSQELTNFLAEPTHHQKEKVIEFVKSQLGSTKTIMQNINA